MIRSRDFRIGVLIAAVIIGPSAISDATAREPYRARHRQSAPAQLAPTLVNEGFATLTPNGPLQIVVSIGAQRLHVYDGEQLIATTKVSTGTGGHPTPTGVFAILDKEAAHRSNIYGGASMPFMQRLTMSGVALHSGMVTGRPASHGCIRLPHNFAKQLFKITKLGTRVTIVPGEAVPAVVEHAQLPVPVAAPQPSTKSDDEGSRAPAEGPVAHAATENNVKTAVNAATTAGAMAVAPKVEHASASRMPRKGQATLEREAGLAAIPISVFVSRLEGKVFVRKGFKPLFDAPVKISEDLRPLGTHVFTAIAGKDGGATFKWIAVSSEAHLDAGPDGRHSARSARKNNQVAAPFQTHTGPSLGPTEALDRIEFSKDAIDQIRSMVTVGATVIVSDHGPSREMRASGTDFVILTR